MAAPFFSTPFQPFVYQALYGREVTTIHDYVPGSAKSGSIEASLTLHQNILSSLKASLAIAKARMIKQANKKRIDKEFAVGDYVFLRLHKYRQATVHQRSNQKLSRRYYGPYKIVQRIGNVAYKLELPNGAKIHPVFHVSLLKPSYGNAANPTGDLTDIYPDMEIASLPEFVMDRRQLNNSHQVLVKWEKMPLEAATWEDIKELHENFPEFIDIEGNVKFQEEGDDTAHYEPGVAGPAEDITETIQEVHEPSTRPKRSHKLPAKLLD